MLNQWFYSHMQTYLPVLSVVALAVLPAIASRSFSKAKKLPPGPRGYPIIGALFQFPIKYMWKTFSEWKKTYGPLIYLNLAGQPVLILNSLKVATDLLDKRASISSDRPRNIVASELASHGLIMPIARYTETWQRMRRAGQEELKKSSVHHFHPFEYREANTLIQKLLDDPSLWDMHLQRATASMIVNFTYGSNNDESELNKSIESINSFFERIVRAATPGTHLVEFFTWMQYLPRWLAPWKRMAEGWYVQDSKMFQDMLHEASQRNTQTGEWNFASSLVSKTGPNHLHVNEAAWISGTLFAAAWGTTSSTLSWFVHAMVKYPQIQTKAQEELDSIVGRSRSPLFSDANNLPYIQAIVKEILRWQPVAPVAIPHCSTEDSWYNGYFIPKGTMCIPNIMGINRDTEIYGPDADEFRPERHLDSNGAITVIVDDTKGNNHVSFGFGKRICIGQHVANDSLFIHIATMLWGCRFELLDNMTDSILPSADECIDSGLGMRPLPFKCAIKPRFDNVMTILENTLENFAEQAHN